MTVKCDYDKETTFKAKFQHKGKDGSLIIVYVPIEEIQEKYGGKMPAYIKVNVEV